MIHQSDDFKPLEQNHIQEDLPIDKPSYRYLLPLLPFTLFFIGAWLLPMEAAQARHGLNLPPSLSYPMGTDALGRSIFLRMIKGFHLTFLIALLGGAAELILGGGYGLLCAILPRRAAGFFMGILDILSSIPYLLLVTLIILWTRSSGLGIICAISFTGWISTARIVRGEALKVSAENYVKASFLMGRSRLHVMRYHILPEISGVLLTSVILGIPKYIFTESFLSFLGFGFSYPYVSWGMIISEAQGSIFFYPYQLTLPSAVLVLSLLGLTIVGNALKKRMLILSWRGYYG